MLIVVTSVPFAIRSSFVAVSLRQSAQMAMIVVVVIVVVIVVVTSAVSAAFDVVASPIIAVRDLTFSTMGATIVSGAADPAANAFCRFAEEPFPQPLDLLSLE